MSQRQVRIGGVFRCCLIAKLPEDAKEGDVVPCPYCGDGLKLVTREDGQHWEACWKTEKGDG